MEPSTDKNPLALTIAPSYTDPVTGAIYIHKDLEQRRTDWENEGHIPPIKTEEHFGDVESWVAYFNRYGPPETFATWNMNGLRAVLDYHTPSGAAGRAQWVATHPFALSLQWKAWAALADGKARTQRQAIESLEDLQGDIVDPQSADLMGIIRNLRGNVTATAQTELRPDGGTSVAFSQDRTVKGVAKDVSLPGEISIRIPVLDGHVEPQGANDREGNSIAGKPVVYLLLVRLRAMIADDARLSLRFSIADADKVLDRVISEQVAAAKRLLGKPILRTI